jgi:hypothetical protein
MFSFLFSGCGSTSGSQEASSTPTPTVSTPGTGTSQPGSGSSGSSGSGGSSASGGGSTGGSTASGGGSGSGPGSGSGSPSGSGSGSGSSGGSGTGTGSGSGAGSGSGSGSGAGHADFTEKKTSLPAGTHMVVTDLNHDGHPDLLVFGTGLEVLLNDGSGDFGGPIQISVPASYNAVQQVAIADFNSDGFPDVAACVMGSNGTSGAAAVYLNDHSGNLILGQVVPVPAACSGIAAGDANRDGKADFAFTYYTGSFSAPGNTVSTWFGDGTGHFVNPVNQSNLALTAQDASMNPCSLAASIGTDFDSDGNLDLLLFGTCQSDVINPGDIYFAHGDGTGHYTLKELSEGNTSVAGTPILTDINHDGKQDVVFLEEQFGPHGSDNSELMYALNDGTGGFTQTKVAGETAYAGDGSYITAGSALNSENTALEGFHSMSCCGTPAAYGVKLFNPVNSAAAQSWIYGQSTSNDLPGRVLAIASADFNSNNAQDFAVLEADANSNLTLHVYVK